MMTTAKAWNRVLWAVEMRGRDKIKPMLIGSNWHVYTDPYYSGEPSRCLLFKTRKTAREWCVGATAKHANHSGGKWKFRPVRVRELVTPIRQTT